MELSIIESLGIEWNLEDLKKLTEKRKKAYLRNLRASIKENPVKVIIEEGLINYPWWADYFCLFKGDIYSIPKGVTRILLGDNKLEWIMECSDGKLKQVIPGKIVTKKLNYEPYIKIEKNNKPKIIRREYDGASIKETSLSEGFYKVRPRFLLTEDGRIFYNVEALFDKNDRGRPPANLLYPTCGDNIHWNYEKGKHLERTLMKLVKLSENFRTYYPMLSE